MEQNLKENLESFSKNDLIKLIHYLSIALKNKSKQANYLNLCWHLDKDLTQEEFEKEIDNNEDKYVIENTSKPDLSELEFIYKIAQTGLFGNKDEVEEDFCSLFGISEIHLDKLMAKIG